MPGGRSKDLVALAALAGAALLGLWLLARSRFEIGAAWSDGRRRFSAATAEGIRHAVWDRPVPLRAGGDAAGGDPALSPDGRFLVFTVGERGLNSELYLAELEAAPAEPRPLAQLDTASDECSPAFTRDALYFASDRPGGVGGLDIWRVPYSGGVFGVPEPAGPGINTPADECDPAPLLDGSLVFASNRARGGRADFDLYRSGPEPDGDVSCTALDGLNTPFDEREPALSPDQRSLYFSSDRGGGFALWRSLLADERWLPAEPVAGLEVAGPARGPWVAAEGFELLFDARLPGAPGEEGERALYRARSRELVRIPPPPVSLQELLLFLALLLLAALAFLSKRWHALDILYKCFLASLLVHLLLLLYLRTVHPRAEPFEGAAGSPAHRVRLAPDEGGSAGPEGLQARAGLESPRAAPERQSLSAPSASPAPELAVLAVPERPPEALPGEGELALEPARLPADAMALVDREESLERYDARAPALALAARAGTDAPAAAPAAEAPARERSSPGVVPAPGPARRHLDAPASPAPDPALLVADAARRSELHAGAVSGAVRETSVELPAESFERAGSSAPQLELSPAASRSVSGGSRPAAPGFVSSEGARASPPSAVPAARGLAAAPPEDPARLSGSVPAPLPTGPAPALSDPGASPDLRSPREAAPPGASPHPVTPFDPLAGLAQLTPPPARPGAPGTNEKPPSPPARAALATPIAELPRPEARPVEAAAPPPVPSPDQTPPRLSQTPYQNRFGQQKLRALEEFGGTPETERAVAAGLAYLASIQEREGGWGQRGDAHEKYLDVRIGKTGLALLAFLGAGHVPSGPAETRGEHAGVSERAVSFLLEAQDRESGHFGQSCSYGHGIATYALAECYALTRDERLRSPLERALLEILRNQHDERDPRFLGGWGYYFADGHVWNGDDWPRVSVSAWQVMALESARLGGLAVDGGAFEAAREFLLQAWDGRRRAFRYDHDPERLSSAYPILPASTPAALFALSLLGVDTTSDELAAARRFVLTRVPDGYRYTGDDDFVFHAQGNLYFWYYATLALFRVGGAEWEGWNEALKATLLPAQAPDGSWPPIDVYAQYAGDEDDERTYTTAMCVLSLEIYYRYFTPLLQVR